jgi:outer membrane protein assembly factor BamD (BamD/ComL family)
MSHSIFDIRRHPLVYCLCALVGFAAISPAAWSAEKNEKKQEISRVIAKEITGAQKAMQANQWSEALKNLEAAETKSPLSTYDKKTIAEFKGICYVRLNNLKAAQTSYEAAVATGGYSAEELPKTYRLLFQLAATNKQDTKAIEYGKQASESGSATDEDLLIMAQLYYQQKDCKNSAVWGDKAVAAFKKAGQPPKEVLFQLKLQCASDANDTGGMKAGLYDLVRLTNKTSYWNNLIRLERQDERDDHNTLMIYRVMLDTNSMNADTDYIEMAQLLGDAGLPGEAQGVLEKAMSTAGVMKDEHKERTTRLLNALKTRADADKKGLSALDAEATKNPAGQLDVKLGEVYFGAGDYQNAATAIARGIGKGQIKQTDEAYVYLGRAQVALKNNAEAKKAFEKLKSVPNTSARVLKLWELYSDKLGS